MTGDEIEEEARYRLEKYFEHEGIQDPTEEFTEAELKEMLRNERNVLIDCERKYGGR